MNKSQRHHYIPIYLIKGFTNPDGQLYRFDKVKAEIDNKTYSPKQVFYKWNLNSSEIDGKVDDFLEKLYQDAESRHAPMYHKIASQTGRVGYTPLEMMYLIMIVATTYWRSPFERESKETAVLSLDDNVLWKIYNSGMEGKISYESYKELFNRTEFVELMRICKPLNDYLNLDIINDIDNWKTLSSEHETYLHVLGDTPVICRDERIHNVLQSDLIFPLSRSCIITKVAGKKGQDIQPGTRIAIDILQFLRSKRYVVGPNKDYLQVIADEANFYTTDKKIKALKEATFNMFS